MPSKGGWALPRLTTFVAKTIALLIASALTHTAAAQPSSGDTFIMRVDSSLCLAALTGKSVDRDDWSRAAEPGADACYLVVSPPDSVTGLTLPFLVQDLVGLRAIALIMKDDVQAHLVLQSGTPDAASSAIGGLDIYALPDWRIPVSERMAVAQRWLTGLSHYIDVTITSKTNATWDNAPAIIIQAEAINEVGDLDRLSLWMRFGANDSLLAAVATGKDRDAERAIVKLEAVIRGITTDTDDLK